MAVINGMWRLYLYVAAILLCGGYIGQRYCYDQCCFRDPVDGRSFIPGNYSRPRTEKGQRQDDKGRVAQGCCEEEERQGGEKGEHDSSVLNEHVF